MTQPAASTPTPIAAARSATRRWFDETGWQLEPNALRAELEQRGTLEDDIVVLLDEGANLRADAGEGAQARLWLEPADYVLGALLLAGAMGPDITLRLLDRVRLEGVTAASFDRDRERFVFEAIEAAVRNGDAATHLVIEAELRRQHRLDAVGADYVRALAKLSPETATAASHARLVVERARNRDLEAGALLLLEATRNGGLVDELGDRLADLMRRPITTRSRMIPGGTFVLTEHEDAAAVWGSDDQVAWAAGEGLMLAGPQGVGKTTVMQQLALARIGIRTAVLGLPVTIADTRPVLYIAADRPSQARRSIRRMVDEADRSLLDEKLIVHEGPPESLLNTDPHTLVRLAQQAGAGTVFVDSLKDVAVKLTDDEAGGRINLAFQYLIGEGIELCVGHHQRKASGENKKPNKLDDVYGSTWITAGLGSVFLLWGEPGDLIVELRHLKQPSEQLGPWEIRHDHVKGMTTVAAQPSLMDLLYRASSEGLTAQDAAAMTLEKPDPTRNEVEKVRRSLERLVDTDKAVKLPGIRGGKQPRYLYNGAAGDPQATGGDLPGIF